MVSFINNLFSKNKVYNSSNESQIKKILNAYGKDKQVTLNNPTSNRINIYDNQGSFIKQIMSNEKFTDTKKVDDKLYVEVPSTAVKSIVFNPNTKTVDLQYTSGDKIYTYRNIDKNEVSNFLNAPSKGRYVVYNWNHNKNHSIFKK